MGNYCTKQEEPKFFEDITYENPYSPSTRTDEELNKMFEHYVEQEAEKEIMKESMKEMQSSKLC